MLKSTVSIISQHNFALILTSTKHLHLDILIQIHMFTIVPLCLHVHSSIWTILCTSTSTVHSCNVTNLTALIQYKLAVTRLYNSYVTMILLVMYSGCYKLFLSAIIGQQKNRIYFIRCQSRWHVTGVEEAKWFIYSILYIYGIHMLTT